jgi:sugar O-acyltransferase (sialic acid O-acetyltransferase NeuD family)
VKNNPGVNASGPQDDFAGGTIHRDGHLTAPVVIYGAGGLGRELLQVLRDMGTPCAGFVVDPRFPSPNSVHGVAVRRSADAFAVDPSVRFVIALGDPVARARVVAELERLTGPRFATIIHPRAWIGDSVSIGEGSMVFGLTSVTADARIGRHVLVNPGTTIAHDCSLSDFATLGPSCALAGGVIVEEGAELGVGVRVAPRVRIGRGAMVGAGAACIRSVPANTTVVGIPAHPILRRGHASQKATT